jgi:hypothetical protein
MTFPIVTELVPVLERVTADTFITGDKPATPVPPVRSPRISDCA